MIWSGWAFSHLGQVVQDLLAEGRVVDGLAVGSGVDRDDMSGGVPAVVLVAEARRLRGFAAVIEEATLCDVLTQAAAVDAAAKAQRDHDCDHGKSVAVYRSTPPGENDVPLTRSDPWPAHQLDNCARMGEITSSAAAGGH